MRRILYIILLLVFVAIMGICQEYNPAEARVKVFPIGDHFYKLQCISGTYVNTLAMTGDEGVLLVDTGYPQTGFILKKEVSKLGCGGVKIVINSHGHSDHVSGNKEFSSEGLIISHENAKQAYGGKYHALKGFSHPGEPELVFKEQMEIYFNGERIHLKHYPGGHTPGDVVVYFPDSKIAFVGDMIFAGCFPGADISNGGDLDRCLENVQKIIDDYPSDTIFINGHGPDYTVEDIKKYLNVGRASRKVVEDRILAGEPVGGIVKSGVLNKWQSWGKGVVSPRDWVTCIHQQFLKSRGKLKISVSKPLSEEIVHGDYKKISKIYHWLKERKNDQYDFSENHLNTLGYHLLNRKMYDEAIEVLRLNVMAYPGSGNVYDSLGEAYMLGGNFDLAARYYKISLEKDPGNENAQAMLKKLER